MEGNVSVITFNRGRLRDSQEVSKTLESLRRYVDGRESLRILIDLTNIDYLASSAIGHLIGILKTCNSGNGAMRLCGMAEGIREIFGILRLCEIIRICKDKTEALASFQELDGNLEQGTRVKVASGYATCDSAKDDWAQEWHAS
jgi:anti-sigma B factor antagonist